MEVVKIKFRKWSFGKLSLKIENMGVNFLYQNMKNKKK